jgi:predicted ATPase
MEGSKESPSNNCNIYFTGHKFVPGENHLDTDIATVIFWPSQDTWNDFGFKCRYEFAVIPAFNAPEMNPFNGELFLGFVAEDEGIGANGSVTLSTELCPAEKLSQFFTLHENMAVYRELVKKLGIEQTKVVLFWLNDLVIYQQQTSMPDWVKEAQKTDTFKLAFMRNADPFYAFHNAGYIISGRESEELGRISENLTLTYKLDGFSNEHRLDLQFSPKSILPKRINILIGKNGLGKSQALYAIVNSMLNGDDGLLDPQKGRPLFSRILAVSTPGETSNTFPEENTDKKIIYKRLILDRTSTKNQLLGFGEICVKLARSEEYIGNQDRWELFLKSISELDPYNSIVIPLDGVITAWHPKILEVEMQKYVPLARIRSGGEQASLEVYGGVRQDATPLRLINGTLHPLSSGQWAFLKFAAQTCLYIENGTLVLFDEPETHLHPNFITKFVRLLDRLLENTGSVAVIASHSAYFVREMPSSQVLVFKESDDNSVNISHPRLKTFGADIGSISFFVFEDSITNTLVDTMLERLPPNKKDAAKAIDDLHDELSSEVLMYLQRRLITGEHLDKD